MRAFNFGLQVFSAGFPSNAEEILERAGRGLALRQWERRVSPGRVGEGPQGQRWGGASRRRVGAASGRDGQAGRLCPLGAGVHVGPQCRRGCGQGA